MQRQNQVVAEANYASAQAAQQAASRASEKEARDHYKSAQKARDRTFDEANSGYPNVGWADVDAAEKALRKAQYRYIESGYS